MSAALCVFFRVFALHVFPRWAVVFGAEPALFCCVDAGGVLPLLTRWRSAQGAFNRSMRVILLCSPGSLGEPRFIQETCALADWIG